MTPLFASTLFVTSALLFALEPMVAKGLLPVLGGGAAVWTTAVAFFQLALLGGYLYAHAAPAWLRPRRHAAVHVALLAVAALALPLAAPAGWVAPASHQALWLFGRFAVTVGPAFVLLAATAPLIQRWLAASGHPEGRDPYFLYAASNAGSLAALAAYPVLLEPLLGLARQRRLWMAGLWVAVALLSVAAVVLGRWEAGSRRGRSSFAGPSPSREVRNPPRVPREMLLRWHWLVLAAVPSSLLLSVTGYMTTDVVALPLLWVLPLALYLLTFILAFSRRARGGQVPTAGAARVQAFLLLPIAAEMFIRTDAAAWVLVPLHAGAFFATALVCHRALADSRPPAAQATAFYLWIAAGGALGGLFNVFVAPALFRTLLEYPLGLVAAALLRPSAPAPDARRARRADVALPAALAVLLLLGVRAARVVAPAGVVGGGFSAGLVALIVLLSAAGVAGYSFRARPLRLGLGLAAIMAAGATYARGSARPLHLARSFYGTHRVALEPPATHTLAHGNTTHGAQDFAPDRRRVPLTYYHPTGPIGAVMAAFEGRPQRARVGVVGLGTGALAAYARPGERWTFFEIDPEVIAIARDPALFTYLADARGDVDVVPGDARLSLASVPDGQLGLLVLDAFTSDAVPAHLLTREALALCLRKLAPGGVVAVHLSNRYLDLEPVVAASARSLGLAALARLDSATPEEARLFKTASHWMVLARSPADLGSLAADPRWLPARAGAAGWTDDASDLWRSLSLLGR